MPIKSIERFIKLESAAGILLLLSAVLAVLVSNSSLSDFYDSFLNANFAVELAGHALSKPLHLWINDGLMAIFFLLVGLEIKRELLQGELNSISKITLPLVAALGGMIVPALIYSFINWGHPEHLVGWAIPTATDIAFSLGILSLLGSRVPLSLKLFLTAVAIFDDIGAIIIIAIYYSSNLQGVFLIGASACILGLVILNRFKVMQLSPYLLIGLILWLFVLKSGVHATLAGVILASTIPIGREDSANTSPLATLEHTLSPGVAYFILPLFGFTNAGLSFADVTSVDLFSPIMLGIALGLVLGKTIGVFFFSWMMISIGWADKPKGSTWMSLLGIALICGIGFTMSLFVGSLAFHGGENFVASKIGVFAGSIFSGCAGYALLRLLQRK